MLGKIIITLFPVAVVLLVSEILWRKKIVKGERARKFIHILAGIWMAFWPFYVSFSDITVLGIVALVVLVYSRFAKLFRGIYDVQRRTYGELLFAVAIILCASLAKQDWIFTMSILFLALADGMAAVVGRFWGISNQYLVFGSRNLLKSWAGTVTYLVTAYVIVIIGWLIGGRDVIGGNILLTVGVLPLTATLLENVGAYGIDNVLTPLYVTLLLNSLL